MDTAIENGDFGLDANGLPRPLSGEEELLQRAAILLRVPLGRFAYQPELGSRLHSLQPGVPDNDANARAMAQEALRTLPQVHVERAICSATEPLTVRVQLSWDRGRGEIEVTNNGDV